MPNTFNVIQPPTIMVRQYDVADRVRTLCSAPPCPRLSSVLLNVPSSFCLKTPVHQQNSRL
jgi:hypothetical protein